MGSQQSRGFWLQLRRSGRKKLLLVFFLLAVILISGTFLWDTLTRCKDNQDFVDAEGTACSDWKGLDCSSAGSARLLQECPVTCNTCDGAGERKILQAGELVLTELTALEVEVEARLGSKSKRAAHDSSSTDGPPPPTLIVVGGACAKQSKLNAEFTLIDLTVDGRPCYESEDGSHFLYFDSHCDGASAPARWIFDSSPPDMTATTDLDGDRDCTYSAAVDSYSRLPPEHDVWRLNCDDGWTGVPMSVVGLVAGQISARCEDSSTFKDENGFSCSEWESQNCEVGCIKKGKKKGKRKRNPFCLTKNGQRDLQVSCPKSCGQCTDTQRTPSEELELELPHAEAGSIDAGSNNADNAADLHGEAEAARARVNMRALEAESINLELIGTLETAVLEVTKLKTQLQNEMLVFTQEKKKLNRQLKAKENELTAMVGLIEGAKKTAQHKRATA